MAAWKVARWAVAWAVEWAAEMAAMSVVVMAVGMAVSMVVVWAVSSADVKALHWAGLKVGSSVVEMAQRWVVEMAQRWVVCLAPMSAAWMVSQ